MDRQTYGRKDGQTGRQRCLDTQTDTIRNTDSYIAKETDIQGWTDKWTDRKKEEDRYLHSYR